MRAKKVAVVISALVFSPLSFAGLSEGNWSFGIEEVDIRNFTSSQMADPATYVCMKFAPDTVSFELSYAGPQPNVQTFGTGTVSVSNNTFYIHHVSRLQLIYPHGGRYYLHNKTGLVVKGRDCTAG